MIARLEVYAIVLVLLAGAVVGAYFKGRSDGKEVIEQQTAAANAQSYKAEADAAIARVKADTDARTAAEDFIARVRRELSDVDAKFKGLPNVVVDARGCSVLGPNFGMRWNAASAAGERHTVGVAGSAVDTVPNAATAAP